MLNMIARKVHESNRTVGAAVAHARNERWQADRRRWLDMFGERKGGKDGKEGGEGREKPDLKQLLAVQRAAAKLRGSRGATPAPRPPYTQPTASHRLAFQDMAHRSSPTLVARPPMVSMRHRTAPLLPAPPLSSSGKSIRRGECGWMVVSAINRELVGARRPILPPSSNSPGGLQPNPPGAFVCCAHDEPTSLNPGYGYAGGSGGGGDARGAGGGGGAGGGAGGGGGREISSAGVARALASSSGPRVAPRRPPSAAARQHARSAAHSASTPTLSLLGMAKSLDTVPSSPAPKRGFPASRPGNGSGGAALTAMRLRARLLSGPESRLRNWVVD